MMHPALAKQKIDALQRQRLDRIYREDVRKFNERLKREKAAFDERLRDPAENVSLGLPAELPEHTIAILAHTQALDKIGAQRPDRRELYRKNGLVFEDEEQAAEERGSL